jgi:glycogen phosphorylase
MKVVFNGGINLSILDGWWDEAYEPKLGWAIGKGEVYADPVYQDEVESNTLYDLLEKELVPSFYDRDQDGLPRGWIARVKASMTKLCPIFSINRMVRQYALSMYFPAVERYELFSADNAAKAKELAAWKKRLNQVWKDVRIQSVVTDIDRVIKVGDDMPVRAWLNLDGLAANDVAVQIYHGVIDTAGDITESEIMPMTVAGEKQGNLVLYSGTIRYKKSGRHGFTVRVVPYHPDMSSPYDTRLIHWASEPVTVTA